MSKVAEDGVGGNITLPESLSNINLRTSINSIGIEVFNGCILLANNIQDSNGIAAFNGCTLLANNIIPESC